MAGLNVLLVCSPDEGADMNDPDAHAQVVENLERVMRQHVYLTIRVRPDMPRPMMIFTDDPTVE